MEKIQIEEICIKQTRSNCYTIWINGSMKGENLDPTSCKILLKYYMEGFIVWQ